MQHVPGAPVVVVGAGLAGLHAAWRLLQAGVEVSVFEARDRVGGRTWSAHVGSEVIERGGEFIAPDDHCLRELCDDLGLELVPHGFSFDCRAAPGQAVPTDDDIEALAEQARRRLGGADDDRSADWALPSRGHASAIQAALIRRLETSLTIPLTDASGRRTLGGGAHRYDPASRIRIGNDAVARGLAHRLGSRVHLRSPVVGVEHGTGSARVQISDGSIVAAAAVVLALPLPLLLELDARPALPAAIIDAAQRLRFGDAAKLHVDLGASARPGGVAAPSANWWCWVSGAGARTVLSCFAGGAAAVRTIGGDSGSSRRWRTAALELWADGSPAGSLDGNALLTHWGEEPWTRGSYSAPGVGVDERDDVTWAAAHGSLVFAGEHTAGDAAATMNGAAASGARAARVVLERVLLQTRRPPPQNR